MRLVFTDPILDALRWLADGEITAPPEALRGAVGRHVLGVGARGILNGNALSRPLALPYKEGELRKLLREWEADNPAFTAWRDAVDRVSRRDGFATNPFGRRAYLRGPNARAFLLLSTAQDTLKEALLASGAEPHRLGWLWVDFKGEPPTVTRKFKTGVQ